MRNLLAAGALACLSLTATSPLMAQDAPNGATVLAVVNGTEITLGHVILLRQQLPEQYLNAPDEVLFDGILEQLIDQTLLGDTLSEETLEMRLSLDNEHRALRAAGAIETALADEPSDEAYQAAYDAEYADLPEDPEFNASHILVETEEEARALLVTLEGGANFAELAKEKSTGPSGPDGGELGWFGIGQMVAPFEAAVLEMEVGQVSDVVETQFGFHVLILNDKRIIPAPTLEEAKSQLNSSINQDRIEAVIQDLRDGAAVETMIEGFDPALMRNIELLRP